MEIVSHDEGVANGANAMDMSASKWAYQESVEESENRMHHGDGKIFKKKYNSRKDRKSFDKRRDGCANKYPSNEVVSHGYEERSHSKIIDPSLSFGEVIESHEIEQTNPVPFVRYSKTRSVRSINEERDVSGILDVSDHNDMSNPKRIPIYEKETIEMSPQMNDPSMNSAHSREYSNNQGYSYHMNTKECLSNDRNNSGNNNSFHDDNTNNSGKEIEESHMYNRRHNFENNNRGKGMNNSFKKHNSMNNKREISDFIDYTTNSHVNDNGMNNNYYVANRNKNGNPDAMNQIGTLNMELEHIESESSYKFPPMQRMNESSVFNEENTYFKSSTQPTYMDQSYHRDNSRNTFNNNGFNLKSKTCVANFVCKKSGATDFKNTLIVQFSKTKMCPYINTKEKCKRFLTNRCPYAHDESELKPIPNLCKTTMCKNFLKNMCSKPTEKCNFAHSVDELRFTDEFYKTTLCKFYTSGYCRADKNCRHAHGFEELKVRPSINETNENKEEQTQGNNDLNEVQETSFLKSATNYDKEHSAESGDEITEQNQKQSQNEESHLVQGNTCNTQTNELTENVREKGSQEHMYQYDSTKRESTQDQSKFINNGSVPSNVHNNYETSMNDSVSLDKHESRKMKSNNGLNSSTRKNKSRHHMDTINCQTNQHANDVETAYPNKNGSLDDTKRTMESTDNFNNARCNDQNNKELNRNTCCVSHDEMNVVKEVYGSSENHMKSNKNRRNTKKDSYGKANNTRENITDKHMCVEDNCTKDHCFTHMQNQSNDAGHNRNITDNISQLMNTNNSSRNHRTNYNRNRFQNQENVEMNMNSFMLNNNVHNEMGYERDFENVNNDNDNLSQRNIMEDHQYQYNNRRNCNGSNMNDRRHMNFMNGNQNNNYMYHNNNNRRHNMNDESKCSFMYRNNKNMNQFNYMNQMRNLNQNTLQRNGGFMNNFNEYPFDKNSASSQNNLFVKNYEAYNNNNAYPVHKKNGSNMGFTQCHMNNNGNNNSERPFRNHMNHMMNYMNNPDMCNGNRNRQRNMPMSMNNNMIYNDIHRTRDMNYGSNEIGNKRSDVSSPHKNNIRMSNVSSNGNNEHPSSETPGYKSSNNKQRKVSSIHSASLKTNVPCNMNYEQTDYASDNKKDSVLYTKQKGQGQPINAMSPHVCGIDSNTPSNYVNSAVNAGNTHTKKTNRENINELMDNNSHCCIQNINNNVNTIDEESIDLRNYSKKVCFSCYQYIANESEFESAATVESSCLTCKQLIKRSVGHMLIESIKPQIQYMFSDINFYVQCYED